MYTEPPRRLVITFSDTATQTGLQQWQAALRAADTEGWENDILTVRPSDLACIASVCDESMLLHPKKKYPLIFVFTSSSCASLEQVRQAVETLRQIFPQPQLVMGLIFLSDVARSDHAEVPFFVVM